MTPTRASLIEATVYLALFAVALALGSMLASCERASHAAVPAVAVAGDLDAGASPTPAPSEAATTAPANQPPTIATPDVLDDPGGAVRVVRETRAEDGWAAAIGVALLILLRTTSKRVQTTSALAFLRRGWWPLALASAVTIVGAVVAVLVDEASWTSVLIAGLTLGLVLLEGRGADAAPPSSPPAAA